MEQGHNIPPEFLGGPGRKGSIQIASYGEKGTDDVIGLELVGFYQRA
jgi:hypothetical protein